MRLVGSWFREVAPEELRAQIHFLSHFIAMLFQHHLLSYHWLFSTLRCDISVNDFFPPCFLSFFHLALSNWLGLSFYLDFIFLIQYHTFLSALKKKKSSIHHFPATVFPSSLLLPQGFNLIKHINHFEGVQCCAWHALGSLYESFFLLLLPQPKLVCLFSPDKASANYGLSTKFCPPPLFINKVFINKSHAHSL